VRGRGLHEGLDLVRLVPRPHRSVRGAGSRECSRASVPSSSSRSAAPAASASPSTTAVTSRTSPVPCSRSPTPPVRSCRTRSVGAVPHHLPHPGPGRPGHAGVLEDHRRRPRGAPVHLHPAHRRPGPPLRGHRQRAPVRLRRRPERHRRHRRHPRVHRALHHHRTEQPRRRLRRVPCRRRGPLGRGLGHLGAPASVHAVVAAVNRSGQVTS
jgi:hypothetical protein